MNKYDDEAMKREIEHKQMMINQRSNPFMSDKEMSEIDDALALDSSKTIDKEKPQSTAN